jgi:uncharacterized protein (DUF2225 family)
MPETAADDKTYAKDYAKISPWEEGKRLPSGNIGAPSLFPKEHGFYFLPLKNESPLLFSRNFTCPLCKASFSSKAVKNSKLVQDKTDPDLRVHYKDIEPMHYEIATCPECWFSAPMETFKDADRGKRARFEKIILPHRAEYFIKTEKERDGNDVFAGFYLALLSTVTFDRPYMIQARMWLKLSRLYHDCRDDKMEKYASAQALKYYLTTYEKTSMNPNQNQQVCFIIGELSFKMNDFKNARNFFFKAKTERSGAAILKRMAEDRIETIRETVKEKPD